MHKIKFNLVSLGCAKNLVDSEELIGSLKARGFQIVGRPEEADLALINTCAFLKEARSEAHETIKQILKIKNGKSRLEKVAVLGCLVQYAGEEGLEKRLPGVDLAVPLKRYPQLPELLQSLFSTPATVAPGGSGLKEGKNRGKENFYHRFLSGSTHSVYLKIAEGCDNRCAYCLIPTLRGRLKSKPMEEVLEEAKALKQMGAIELNLVAQDTSAYGLDLYGTPRLDELLQKLSFEMEGKGWIRLLYTHPARLTEDLLRVIARDPAVCNYIDMPIQHASSEVLRRMGRRVTKENLVRAYNLIRETVPDVALRTTVMVGFPGEGEKEFEELLDFLQQYPFEKLGAFCYSPEKGTPAFHFSQQSDPQVAQARLEKLMSSQKKISRSFNRSLLGNEIEMLVDRFDGQRQRLIGRLFSQAPEVDGKTVAKTTLPASPGQFVRIRVTGAGDYDLLGERILYEPGQ